MNIMYYSLTRVTRCRLRTGSWGYSSLPVIRFHGGIDNALVSGSGHSVGKLNGRGGVAEGTFRAGARVPETHPGRGTPQPALTRP